MSLEQLARSGQYNNDPFPEYDRYDTRRTPLPMAPGMMAPVGFGGSYGTHIPYAGPINQGGGYNYGRGGGRQQRPPMIPYQYGRGGYRGRGAGATTTQSYDPNLQYV